MVPGMTEPPRRYDVTVTVSRDGGYLPDPAEFAVAAGQPASSRAARVVSAHTAGQIISVVTVETADRFTLATNCQFNLNPPDPGLTDMYQTSDSGVLPSTRS
jgi:hypothetical protein